MRSPASQPQLGEAARERVRAPIELRPGDRPVGVDHGRLVGSRDRVHDAGGRRRGAPPVEGEAGPHEPVRADRAQHASPREHRDGLGLRLQGKPHGANHIGRAWTGGGRGGGPIP